MRLLPSLMMGLVSVRTHHRFNAPSSFDSDIHSEGKRWSRFRARASKISILLVNISLFLHFLSSVTYYPNKD
jgi:hypothetical protein